MKHKSAAQTAPRPEPDASAGAEALAERVKALELELEQKNVLLEQGFAAFTQAAEKLQESHKRLQQQVAELNVELDEKNQALERNLEEREKVKTYLANIFDSLPVGVLVTDLQGAVTSVNRAGLDMLSQDAEGLVGHDVNEVLGTRLLTRSGRVARPNKRLDLDEPLTYNRSDGEALKLQLSLTPMTGEGKPLGIIVNMQDVTLLKQLEEHAERRNRFTAMGEMAANIAHEIRNPLGSIELFTSLVKRGLSEDDERLVLVNHISSGISSMNHVISNVLEYTKPRPANLRVLDVQRTVREVGEFLRYMAGQNNVQVEVRTEEGERRVRGDEDLLKQVFHNLMLNAVQAMTDGGRLTVFTRTRTVTNPKLLERFGAVSEDDEAEDEALEIVEVHIQDTGPGIPKETLNQVFDPFFTTKSRGTGLGLAIVHNIVESHQGVIDVESRQGEGTEFILMFPLVRG